MSVSIESTLLNDVLVLQLQRFHDSRGYFEELGRANAFAELGIPQFVQANHSRSRKGVLRGLHAQPDMGKLLFVIHGTVQFVELDIRPTSATFGQQVSITVSDSEPHCIWAPPGFANGFCILSESADVVYQCTGTYNATQEIGIHPLDADLSIPWEIEEPILSARDRESPSWQQVSLMLKANTAV